MTLDILICTMEDRLQQIAQMLLPQRTGIAYVVSCQYATSMPAVPSELSARPDVKVVFLQGRGLSRNRNNAIAYALGDILLIADDDERFNDAGLDELLHIYEANPELDIALFKVDGLDKYYPHAHIHYTTKDLRGAYYVSSVEMTMRRSSIGDVKFNPHFGLGSEYLSCGEEFVFLHDSLSAGLHVEWFPVTIAATTPQTTGSRFLHDAGVQRSKGAVFCYVFGAAKALVMCLNESLHHFVYKGVNPFRLMSNMRKGISYAKSLKP